jgi:hypothetical protein
MDIFLKSSYTELQQGMAKPSVDRNACHRVFARDAPTVKP